MAARARRSRTRCGAGILVSAAREPEPGGNAAARTDRSLLLSPEETLAVGERRVGGKAYGLARLAAVGACVPPFFVVTTDAFAAHLAQSGLVLRELDRLAALDPNRAEDMVELDDIARQLRATVEAQALDPWLGTRIEQQLARGHGPFAVRSSMVGEDSAAWSFAGQLESHLFQQSSAEVAAALVRCWGSAFSARVLTYKLRSGEPLGLPRMGVVIQQMVDGEVSGVLFTAHPVTGRRDHTLVTSAWGAGEGVVSGLCNADEAVIDRDGHEHTLTLAHKDVAVVRAESGCGTATQPVPAERRDARALPADRTGKLAAEGRRVAEAFGRPLDIEWTWDGDKIYLLQARPITRLPAPENGDGPRVVWDNSNIQESYCGVTTPLTFSFALAAYTSVYEQFLRALGVSEATIADYQPVVRRMIGLVRGRVYYNINNWYRLLLVLPGFGRNKQDMERMMGLDSPVDFVEDQVLGITEKMLRAPRLALTYARLRTRYARIDGAVERFLADFARQYQAADRARIPTLSFSQLMALRKGLIANMLGNWETPIINDFYVMMANGHVRRLIERAVGAGDAQRMQSQLMGGEEGIESTEPTRMLLRMAKRARGDSELCSTLREGAPLAALARVREHYPDFAELVGAYIEKYGDRCMGELKLETVSLREDPSFIVHTLRNFLDRPDLDPDALLARERAQREEAWHTVTARLSLAGRVRLDRALAAARKAVKHRENMRLSRTRGFGLYRDISRALGERLFEAGCLDEPRDVFYLTGEELEGYHEGAAVSADLRGLARVRKAEYTEFARQDLPHRFETVGPVHHGNRFAASNPVPVDLAQRVLRGIGCYPGVAQARARVIMSPEDDLALGGRILVTLRTDPGWAPLFPSASGILVERGSTLSHSAILARELGIPAVVGVPNLLKIVQDGDELRLDGGAGTVERL
jgi:pyruvate,water dikinase